MVTVGWMNEDHVGWMDTQRVVWMNEDHVGWMDTQRLVG